ncbi:MAG TPA: hypothetical protein VKS79_22990 [Gemmataceae bacterium]|nr:hypothetical protein [Gemmataceae bacterium]
MHRQSPEFMVGLLVGALVAGALCGLLPLSIALARKRVDLAIGSMFACIVCGFCGGLLIAGPAAVILAATIYAIAPRPRESEADESRDYKRYYREYSEPAEAHFDRALSEQDQAKPKPKNSGASYLRCSACGREVRLGLGVAPPWCQGCGADLCTPDVPKPAAPTTQDDKAPSPEAITVQRPV